MDLKTEPTTPLLPRDFADLCRPRHWVKNVFVLAPLLFSGQLTRLEAWWSGGLAMACFCLLSSAVYCINDMLDAPADRQHPRKRLRPIPSGRVSATAAFALAMALIGAAGALALAFLPVGFAIFGLLYLLNNLLYCGLLKHRVIVDVLAIAIGFVLRLLAGCEAVSVQPTSWIIVCGFSLAMLLGFGKRRLEIEALDRPSDYRSVLQSYSPDKLNLLLGISSAVCLLSYILYTVAPETVKLHQTDKLVYTVPFVAYGIFRYLFKTQEGRHDGPVEVLLQDAVFTVNALLWVLGIVVILYTPKVIGG